jgi:hypothetical protein
MVKFDRDSIKDVIEPQNGKAIVTVTGKVLHDGDERLFSGRNVIKIKD